MIQKNNLGSNIVLVNSILEEIVCVYRDSKKLENYIEVQKKLMSNFRKIMLEKQVYRGATY